MVASFGKQERGFFPEAINAPEDGKLCRNQGSMEHSAYQLYQVGSRRGWWLRAGENKIGRGFDNDIVVTDISVSRHHAVVYVEGAQVFIRDLNSTNGVYVGGTKVKDSVLYLDSIFKVGKVDMALIRPNVDNKEHQGGWSMIWD